MKQAMVISSIETRDEGDAELRKHVHERRLRVIEVRHAANQPKLRSLRAQGAKAFAIDLRRNAGGFLGGGIDTARLLLPRARAAQRPSVPAAWVFPHAQLHDLVQQLTICRCISQPRNLCLHKGLRRLLEACPLALPREVLRCSHH